MTRKVTIKMDPKSANEVSSFYNLISKHGFAIMDQKIESAKTAEGETTDEALLTINIKFWKEYGSGKAFANLLEAIDEADLPFFHETSEIVK